MSSEPRIHSRLAQRYFRRTLALTLGLLVVAGVLEAVFAYREARLQMTRLQALQAQAAATEIEQYLRTIERAIESVQQLPWGQPGFDAKSRREELHRLLALTPALVALFNLDQQGHEQLAVARAVPDRVADGRQHLQGAGSEPGSGAGYADAEFDAHGEPTVQWQSTRAGQAPGRTLAVINLRFLADVVSGLRVADGGRVYVVDRRDQMVVHADATQTLRQLRLTGQPALTAARQAVADATRLEAVDAPGIDGHAAVTTAVVLPSTGWLVFVEHPRAQAMQPVWAALWRTAGLLGIAAMLAALASAGLARRLARPIARLRAATAEMAEGRLDQRVELQSGDEVEALAEDFNRMALRLRASHADLENQVQVRTAELVLRRDEAEQANVAKTRFLASASHDLRQPMHAIGLLVGVLRERMTQDEARVLADKTYEAVLVMERMFGSLLDISKLDAGAVQPQVQTFVLGDVLQRVQQVYAPLAAARGIRLKVRPSALMLRTDPALLERIVGNLVGNALRYTPRGWCLVVCRRRGGALLLQVADSGVGIEPEAQAVIFDEFVRGGQPTAGGEQGLGLGLSIVRRTAQLLGMQVRVQSRPGRGSVFELEMPAVLQMAEASGVGGELSVAQRQIVAGTFVLVVDDDMRNREASAMLLQQWGCLVAVACDLASAQAELERHLRAPDLVLTDLRLGGGADGLQLIESLRTQYGADLPALLVTADVQLPAITAPNTHHLNKPVGSRRLLQVLSAALVPRTDSMV